MPHGELSQTGQPARTYEPTPLSLTDSEKAALKALADDRFEGNRRAQTARLPSQDGGTVPVRGLTFTWIQAGAN